MFISNVVTVIVTYNRISFFEEYIASIWMKTLVLDEIIIVNNWSNEGTTKWLSQQVGLTVINQQNLGGSGGFYTGLKYAAKTSAKWIWAMDDDTICQRTALSKMFDKIAFVPGDKIGFMCSKVVWKDGMAHFMNLPDVKLFFNENLPFNAYDQQDILLAQNCSFVSVLITKDAVKSVGLPYKDFYIWGDDEECTRRITKAGYLGVYGKDSIAFHKSRRNHRA